MSNATQKYSKSAVVLHGLTAVMIFMLFAIGWYMTELPKDVAKTASLDLFDLGIYTVQFADAITPRTFYFNLHKSIGITVLLLILARVYVRLGQGYPAFPSTMKAWEIKLAELTHKALYLLMLAVPLTGLVMAVSSKYGLVWFGLHLIPGMDNAGLRDVFKESHEVIGVILITVIALHIAAALKHKLVDKDDVMSRMSLK